MTYQPYLGDRKSVQNLLKVVRRSLLLKSTHADKKEGYFVLGSTSEKARRYVFEVCAKGTTSSQKTPKVD